MLVLKGGGRSPCSSHFTPTKEAQYPLYWRPVHSYKELFVLFYILCSNLSICLLHIVKLPSLARHQTTVLCLLTLLSKTSLHTCTAHSQVPLLWYQFTLLYEVTPQFPVHYHHTLRHTIHKTANDLNHNILDDMIFCTPLYCHQYTICTITHTLMEVHWYLAITPWTYI
jgi:hypothetical protein